MSHLTKDKINLESDGEYKRIEIDEEEPSKNPVEKKQTREQQDSTTQEPQKQELKSLILAFFAGVCFALWVGVNAGLGVLTREMAENGSLIYAIIFCFCSAIKALYDNKPYWNWQLSNFRDPNTDGFHWCKFWGALGYTLNNVLAGFLVVFTFQFAIYANMNQGILTSLFSFSLIFSAFMAYFIFGDRLRVWHVIGIIFMVLYVVGLGLGSSSQAETVDVAEDSQSPLFYSMIAILFDILSPISFSVGGLTVRYLATNYLYNPVDLTITCYIWSNIILII